jgi:hypothetical protein
MLEIDISTRANPGCVLLIDECDRHLVDGLRWTPTKQGLTIYAHRKPRREGKLYLHRLIMRPAPGLVVDHIDRNGLNNTRANLRVVPQEVNQWNRGGHGASAFKGIYPKRGKWSAAIKQNDESYALGVFDTEEEAALVFDAAALFFGRDRTGLNFPDRATAPAFDPQRRQKNEWGYPGVRSLPSGRFGVRVLKDGERFSIGSFATAEAAAEAARKQMEAAQ